MIGPDKKKLYPNENIKTVCKGNKLRRGYNEQSKYKR